jgi:hypothetical protein
LTSCRVAPDAIIRIQESQEGSIGNREDKDVGAFQRTWIALKNMAPRKTASHIDEGVLQGRSMVLFNEISKVGKDDLIIPVP